MATTTPNTHRTEMRASKWNRALVAVCPRVGAFGAIQVMNGMSDALAARSVR